MYTNTSSQTVTVTTTKAHGVPGIEQKYEQTTLAIVNQPLSTDHGNIVHKTDNAPASREYWGITRTCPFEMHNAGRATSTNGYRLFCIENNPRKSLVLLIIYGSPMASIRLPLFQLLGFHQRPQTFRRDWSYWTLWIISSSNRKSICLRLRADVHAIISTIS